MEVNGKKIGNAIVDVMGIIAIIAIVLYALAWLFGGCIGSTCFQSHKLTLNGEWNNQRARQLENQVLVNAEHPSSYADEPIYRESPPIMRPPLRRPGGMAYGSGPGPGPGRPGYGMDRGHGPFRFRIDGEHHRCKPCFNAGEWQDNTCRCHGTAMLTPE